MKSTSSLWARMITIHKSVLGATLDEINRYYHNKLFQQEGTPQSMQFHLLWRGPNGPRANVLEITVFLAILECHSNCRDTSNAHISSPWKSANLCCTDIPMECRFWKTSFYEVFPGNSCNFSNFSLFLLSFLAFFPVI
jgi:hypothetical protein